MYEMAYSFLSEELKQSNEGQETLKKINLVKQLDEGLKFPPFEVLNINKQAMSLSQIKLKKFTRVDFWFQHLWTKIILYPFAIQADCFCHGSSNGRGCFVCTCAGLACLQT
jgi:hypothetical protein